MKETTVELLHFRFWGGDVPRYRVDGPQTQPSPAWQNAVQRIGRTRFPTNPPTGAVIDDMVFINRPGGTTLGNGIRIHCVYFRARGSRPFQNVFCFAYRNAECPLSVFASVSAEEWWDACRTLSEQSTFVTLPCHIPPRDLPELVDVKSGYLLYRFPNRNGRPITGEITEEEFEQLLAPPVNRPSPNPPPSPLTLQLLGKLKRIFEEYWLGILVLLLLGMILFLLCVYLFRSGGSINKPSVILREEPYGLDSCKVCMGSRKIIRVIQCPQCGGKKATAPNVMARAKKGNLPLIVLIANLTGIVQPLRSPP